MPALSLRSTRRALRQTSLDARVTAGLVALAVLGLGWVLTRPAPPPPQFLGTAPAAALRPCSAAIRAPATCSTATATLVLGRPGAPVRVGDAEAEVLRLRLAGTRVGLEVHLRNVGGRARSASPSQIWLTVAGRHLSASPGPVSRPLASGASATRRLSFPLTGPARRAVVAGGQVDVGIAPFTPSGGRRTVGVVRATVARS